jgi:hypothetical protein
MTDEALFDDAAFDASDEFEEFDLGADGFDEFTDELSDEFDEADAWDDVEALDADGYDGLEDEFGDFALDEESGLFMPGASSLVSGPAATSMMRALNSAVMSSLDADEADSFFGRVGGFLGGLAKRAAPFVRKALPMVQKIAGSAGPWGRLVSAGLGGVQGLMDGKGLQGALQGAVGGLLPGGAGGALSGLLGGVLGGDGADDDAAVDAMADWADAHHGHHVAAARIARAGHAVNPSHIHAARPHSRAVHAHGPGHTGHSPAHRHVQAIRLHRGVALPIGAGLTTRAVARHVLGHALRHAARGPVALSHVPALMPRLRHMERTLLRVANQVPGTTGRRLRAVRHIGHQVAHAVNRHGVAGLPAMARALPTAVRLAVQRTVPRILSSPRAFVRSPAAAGRRVILRKRIIRRIPIEILFRAHIVRRAA